MANFPTSLDELTDGIVGRPLNNPDHTTVHNEANDAIGKIEAKLGIDGSTDVNSLDWKINHLELFPIGSVFISVVSTNPNTLLGYGTWTAIATGRVLVGLDSGDADFDVVEETGGAKTSTPDAHSGATVGNHIAKNTDAADTGVTAKGSTGSTLTLKAHFHNISQYVHTVGQAIAHAAMSIVQPYFVVYMWKRTA